MVQNYVAKASKSDMRIRLFFSCHIDKYKCAGNIFPSCNI